MTMPLHEPKQHDLHQAAHVQAIGRAIKADITADHSVGEGAIKCLSIGALKNVAASGRFGEKSTMWHDNLS
jgi:hypothetical protein